MSASPSDPDRRVEERRGGKDRRQTVDLTRRERGEPERRAMPGLERRAAQDRRDGSTTV